MSVDNSILLRRKDMPTPEAWQQSLNQAGFQLTIDTDFDVDDFVGFLPCELDGEECGFEFSAEDIDLDELVADGDLTVEQREALADRTFLVTLSTRSSFRDGLSSVFAAAALCAIADGMLSCEGEPFIAAADAAGWARSVEPEMRTGIAEQAERERRRSRKSPHQKR